MDEYGLWTWGAAGESQLSPTAFTMRVAYTADINPSTYPAGKYFDISIEGVNSSNSAAFCIPNKLIDRNSDKQLEPEVINGGVRVWRTIRGDPYGTSSYSITGMRLVVVRFK